jgi:hypothetical protein
MARPNGVLSMAGLIVRIHLPPPASPLRTDFSRGGEPNGTGGLGDNTLKAQCRQIHFVDERFNHPDRVVLPSRSHLGSEAATLPAAGPRLPRNVSSRHPQ